MHAGPNEAPQLYSTCGMCPTFHIQHMFVAYMCDINMSGVRFQHVITAVQPDLAVASGNASKPGHPDSQFGKFYLDSRQ